MGSNAGAKEAEIEETGVVGGHVEVVLTAVEDSRHHDRVAELPIHGAAVLKIAFLICIYSCLSTNWAYSL